MHWMFEREAHPRCEVASSGNVRSGPDPWVDDTNAATAEAMARLGWRMTRPAVIYVLAMVALYVVFGVFGVFDLIPVPIQDVVGTVYVIGTLPAGLLVLPLYLGISLLTGNVFLLGDSIPFLTEIMQALAIFLNALLINRWVRRARLI